MASPVKTMVALVLGGGNALGSYLAGAYQALHEEAAEPDWIAGSSIGAITGALIAGNTSDKRLERLRTFWDLAAAPDLLPWARGSQWAAAIQARLLGRPSLFHPLLARLHDAPDIAGVYDTAPTRRLLSTLIDFDRLNDSNAPRLSVLAVDLHTGEEVVFDNRVTPITLDHLMASAALVPDFPPVRIGERWLADGGLAANVPVDLVLGQEPKRDMQCFLVDLFPLDGPLPQSLATASMRQTDLMFAVQTDRTLRAMIALDRARPAKRPRIAVVRTSYAAEAEETAMKSWDYSEASIVRRWESGRVDMREALQRFRKLPPGPPGLTIHPIQQRGRNRNDSTSATGAAGQPTQIRSGSEGRRPQPGSGEDEEPAG